jgi:hypothetical protein
MSITLEATYENGTLRLTRSLPLREHEKVLVTVVPSSADTATTDERGWPLGFFEETFGSITDETFARPPQGSLPAPVNFD